MLNIPLFLYTKNQIVLYTALVIFYYMDCIDTSYAGVLDRDPVAP